MNTFWEKLVFGTKVTILGIVALCAVLLIAANWGVSVPTIHLLVVPVLTEVSLEKVLLIDSVLSIAGWWLFWAVYRAIRRIKVASASRTTPISAPTAPSSTPATPASGGNMPFTPPK